MLLRTIRSDAGITKDLYPEMTFFIFVLGLFLIIIGAEALVRGASRLASFLGLSPLVIGLTVVALATSSPELAVSVKAAISGQGSVAVGNVVGSNIFNVLFILGLSALILPLAVSHRLVRFNVPLMVILSVAVLLLSLDGMISRLDGCLLMTGLVVYLWFLVSCGRRKNIDEPAPLPGGRNGSRPWLTSGWPKDTGLVLGGLVLLVLGSHWLVDSVVSIAHYMGVSELIIGLTVVAAATSLPEAATSIVAAFRGERDIAVGNIIGSNIFNLLGVLGLAGITAPAGIAVSSAVIGFDLPVMIAVALACLPVFFTNGLVSRPEGALFFGYYLAYILYLLQAASHHDALLRFNALMLYAVLPLTAITLVLMALRHVYSRRRTR